MKKIPMNAGHSQFVFALFAAGLLVLLAGSAALAQPAWPIYASAGDNGAISPAGTVYVPDGGGVSFTFVPAPSYMVYQVIIDGNVIGGGVPGYTFEGVHGQHSILVTFTPMSNIPYNGYGGVVVAPGPDLYLFGGGFDRRRVVHDFSRRGAESRAVAHPEVKRPEHPGGDERGGDRGGRR